MHKPTHLNRRRFLQGTGAARDVAPWIVFAIDAAEEIANRERLRVQLGSPDLFPIERGRYRGAWYRAHRVRSNAVLTVGVAKIVDEDAIAAFVLALLDREALVVATGD